MFPSLAVNPPDFPQLVSVSIFSHEVPGRDTICVNCGIGSDGFFPLAASTAPLLGKGLRK